MAALATRSPHRFRRWQEFDRNIVVLAATDEQALTEISEAIHDDGHHDMALFREPDLGDSHTATSVLGTRHDLANRLGNLPLAR